MMMSDKPKEVICALCKRPIHGKVYYQANLPDFPVHKNCRIVIRGPKIGE
jgi:hypothetical protein